MFIATEKEICNLSDTELLNCMIASVKKDLDDLNIQYEDKKKITINSRLSTTRGRVVHRHSEILKIELSALLVKSRDLRKIQNTICHELLHTNPECLRTSCTHDGEWARLMNIVNQHGYDVRAKYPAEGMTELERKKDAFHYSLECQNCGWKKGYRRNSSSLQTIRDHPDSHPYLCPKCGKGTFKILPYRKEEV